MVEESKIDDLQRRIEFCCPCSDKAQCIRRCPCVAKNQKCLCCQPSLKNRCSNLAVDISTNDVVEGNISHDEVLDDDFANEKFLKAF